MNDLMETFAEAKFGKQAFLGQLFGSMDPKKRAIRDKIEDMIREEQRKRDDAKAAIEYGKYRLNTAGKPSTLGWLSDISRSLIPGLSVSAAAAVDDLVKQSADDPNEGLAGRAFDLAHLGAAGAGGGLGYAAAKGALGTAGSANRIVGELGGSQLLGEMAKTLGGDRGKLLRNALGTEPKLVALAAQKPSILTKVLEKISPTYWWRTLVSKTPATADAARSAILSKLTAGGAKPETVASLMKDLPGALTTARSTLAPKILDVGKRIPFKGKIGALAGALAASLPFIGYRLYKTRKLRASGGTAGQAAVRKAEELLSGADQLRKEREGLMTQLA